VENEWLAQDQATDNGLFDPLCIDNAASSMSLVVSKERAVGSTAMRCESIFQSVRTPIDLVPVPTTLQAKTWDS
jgi:hypothetical protein